MLTEHPDMKLMTVAHEAGFASEVSFFRTFKAVTGSTPKEWLKNHETTTKN
jgi:AraC-like DNA-binding protein